MAELSISKLQENTASGWLNGFIGVLLFSGSLPATRMAVLAFDPVFVTLARASIAGILALVTLMVFKEKRPERKQMGSLCIVAIGCVAAHHLCALYRFYRYFAGIDSRIWYYTRWRASEANLLAVLCFREPTGDRLCAGTRTNSLTFR